MLISFQRVLGAIVWGPHAIVCEPSSVVREPGRVPGGAGQCVPRRHVRHQTRHPRDDQGRVLGDNKREIRKFW